MTNRHMRNLSALEADIKRLVANAIRSRGVVRARSEAARMEDAFPECDMSKEEIARLIISAARSVNARLDDLPAWANRGRP